MTEADSRRFVLATDAGSLAGKQQSKSLQPDFEDSSSLVWTALMRFGVGLKLSDGMEGATMHAVALRPAAMLDFSLVPAPALSIFANMPCADLTGADCWSPVCEACTHGSREVTTRQT